MASKFEVQRSIEQREIDRLSTHLATLDADGWLEQSYDAEWRVYQVVSHLASGARQFQYLLEHWFDGAPPLTQERMRGVWATFDALEPGQMHEAYTSAMHDYFARLNAVPADTGLQEVDSFFGRMPLENILTFRLNEVVLHVWDVLVARDRSVRLPDDTFELVLPAQLHIRAMRPSTALAGKRVRISATDRAWQRLIDFRGEKPQVSEDAAAETDISVEAPAEEISRLLTGRHFLPGSLPRLTWTGGSYQDVAALSIFAG
jgi:uncharacterized protein (TIGR03083 family)